MARAACTGGVYMFRSSGLLAILRSRKIENTNVTKPSSMAMRSGAALAAFTLMALIPDHGWAGDTATFRPLHQFDSPTDGAFPQGALLRDAAGNLYGTTTSGGGGDGTVFKIDSAGHETVLFDFINFFSGSSPA